MSIPLQSTPPAHHPTTQPCTATALFKALADDVRLRSLLLIEQQGELCVCELMAALDESQPKVSRHLAQLRRAGILSDRRQGQWVYYALHPALPDWMTALLRLTASHNPALLSPALANLRAMSQRPPGCGSVL